MKRRGFTLVELLVVIGVIAVLVAMLLPALAKARLQSTRVACMSNMRQSLMSMHMYASQYGQWPMNISPQQSAITNDPTRRWPRAPAWGEAGTTGGGLEGSPPWWRGYLIEGKFGNGNTLGCISSIASEPQYTIVGLLTPANQVEDANVPRKAPPWIYWGFGTDPARVAVYGSGFKVTGNPLRGRDLKLDRERHPLFHCPFLGSNGVRLLTPHSFMDAGPWSSPGDGTPRAFDHIVGWSDGSASHIFRKSAIGTNDLLKYNWQ